MNQRDRLKLIKQICQNNTTKQGMFRNQEKFLDETVKISQNKKLRDMALDAEYRAGYASNIASIGSRSMTVKKWRYTG